MRGLLSVLLFSLLLGFSSLGEGVKLTRPEEGVLQAETGLVRYEFRELGGILRSAHVHFTGYQLPPVETVPGWEGTTKPSLALGVSLPFEVWLGDALVDPGRYEVRADQAKTGEARVQLSWAEGPQAVQKTFALDAKALYTAPVEIRVRAPGQRVRLVLGHRPTGKDAPELVFVYDGKKGAAPLVPGAYTAFQGLGLVSKDRVYFLKVEGGNVLPFLGVNANGQPVFGLEAMGELSVSGLLYTGRNRAVLLEKAGLQVLSSPGVFGRFLVWVMVFFEWLYRFTGNYGWAIILFTLATRVAVYPLTRNQHRAMAKMQRIAPKLKKLQERYKDDPETLRQQMMELYKQERVNPLGGCLPLLLQLPILILLWQAILYSAEQIHLSPGFLWVRDLSQPDPYYALIALATGAQWLQQWLTQRRLPETPSGGTQLMGWIFPLVMALLFLSFPAGLWLYWLVSTVLQIGQQLFFDWELAREGRAAAGDGTSA